MSFLTTPNIYFKNIALIGLLMCLDFVLMTLAEFPNLRSFHAIFDKFKTQGRLEVA